MRLQCTQLFVFVRRSESGNSFCARTSSQGLQVDPALLRIQTLPPATVPRAASGRQGRKAREERLAPDASRAECNMDPLRGLYLSLSHFLWRYTYIHVHICTYAYMPISIYIYTHIFFYLFIYTYRHIHVYYACMYACRHLYVYINVYTYMFVQTVRVL